MTSVIDFFEKTKRATERILRENKDRVKIIFDYIVVIASMVFLVWASLNIGQSMPTMGTIGFAYMGFIIANKLSPNTSVLLIVFVVAAFKSNETDDTIGIIVADAAVIISYAAIFFMEIKERNSFYKERLIAATAGTANFFAVQAVGINPITIASMDIVCCAKLLANIVSTKKLKS